MKLLAPIYDPEKIVCVGMNYREHCTEQGIPIPTEPVIFSKFASAICASGDPIPWEVGTPSPNPDPDPNPNPNPSPNNNPNPNPYPNPNPNLGRWARRRSSTSRWRCSHSSVNRAIVISRDAPQRCRALLLQPQVGLQLPLLLLTMAGGDGHSGGAYSIHVTWLSPLQVEMVIVVGRAGKHVKKEEATQHIAGWTVAHDVSARDWQLKRNGGQWLLGKTCDGFAPIGPAIVTRDELPDVSNLGTLVS